MSEGCAGSDPRQGCGLCLGGLEAGGLETMTSERYGCPGYLRSDLKNLECICAAQGARLMQG